MVNGFTEQTKQRLLDEGTILAKDLINYKLGYNVQPVNATARTLRKLSDDIESKTPDLLEQLCSKLNFSKETGYKAFCELANEVFSDGIVNWGRIVVLFAFSARLGKYCSENNMSSQIDNIIEWAPMFVTGLGWIETQGGWVGTLLRLLFYETPQQHVGAMLGSQITRESSHSQHFMFLGKKVRKSEHHFPAKRVSRKCIYCPYNIAG